MPNVVAYGTLMFPEVANPIAQIYSDGEPVTVPGYRRYEADIERNWGKYPAIVPDESTSFDGLLFTGLSKKQLKLLDWFEDVSAGLYKRKTRTLERPNGKKIQVELYVCGPLLRKLIRSPFTKAWSPVLFRQNELAGYLSRIVYPAVQSSSYQKVASKK